MDETPHALATDGKRRRLLFRANHRGTRENDILVGGFVSARLADFSEAEIDEAGSHHGAAGPGAGRLADRAGADPGEHDSPLLRAMREARGT